MAHTILIVDDSSVTRKVIKRHLSQGPFADAKILEAGDGEEALSLIKEKKVDLVLSDWNMPKLSGIDFVAKVRESEMKLSQYTGKIPVIMITTEGTMEKIDKAFAVGVSEYITKPFNSETLIKTIKKVFSSIGIVY